MKFKVTLKAPDALDYAIKEAVQNEMSDILTHDEDERDDIAACVNGSAVSAAAKWFRYGECLTVEIDTDTQTITVCPAS